MIFMAPDVYSIILSQGDWIACGAEEFRRATWLLDKPENPNLGCPNLLQSLSNASTLVQRGHEVTKCLVC
jgi:hypothetical protein